MKLVYARLLKATALALVGLAAEAESSRADLVLGTAVNYGVLTGPSIGNFQLSSDTHITGNIGVGSSDGTTTGTNNNIKFANANVVGNLSLGGTNTNGIGGTVTGTVSTQVADVATAYNTISTLSTNLALETGTALDSGGNFTGTTINASDGKLDASGNEVFSSDVSKFKPSGALTINGTADQYVVINLTGNSNFSFTQPITLTGGITEDHVLYNITGVGKNLQIAGNAHGGTIQGIIVALNDKISLDNVLVNGRVFGGEAGQDFQLVSNFSLVQPATVPEPASLVMMGLGGGMAFVVFRRKRPAFRSR